MSSSKKSVTGSQTAILSDGAHVTIVPEMTMVPSGGMILTLGSMNLYLDAKNAIALADFIAECVMRESFLDTPVEDVSDWH